MRLLKVAIILPVLITLFGCSYKNPYILDGPGMVYVDSEYRNEFSNCLPFEDVMGPPYLAIAYLGNDSEYKTNMDFYTNQFFKELGNEKIKNIPCYSFDGEDWYLVIQKYNDQICLLKDGKLISEMRMYDSAFLIRCNSDITINLFNNTDIYYTLSVDKNNSLLNTDENVWDITELIN